MPAQVILASPHAVKGNLVSAEIATDPDEQPEAQPEELGEALPLCTECQANPIEPPFIHA